MAFRRRSRFKRGGRRRFTRRRRTKSFRRRVGPMRVGFRM